MTAQTTPACLIDASIYIFRYYFSLPDNWHSEEGYATSAVYGYTSFLLNLLEHVRPELAAACYDESLGSCFRNDIYADYKCSRALPDEELAFQLTACREVAELLGLACFGSKRYEADDLLGTLSKLLSDAPSPVALITRDKDLGQLLAREQDFLWHPEFKPRTGSDTGERLYRPDLAAKFGVQPEQMADYLALVGDAIDDIPGVPGLGPKTAQALLGAYADIDSIFANHGSLHQLPIRGAKSLAAKLLEYRQQIGMARQLATITVDVPLAIGVADLRVRAPDMDGLANFCERMGLGRLIKRAETALGHS